MSVPDEDDYEAVIRWGKLKICGLFRCPLLKKDGSCPKQGEEQGCPFDHSSNTRARTVPKNICIPNMLAECQREACPRGMHLLLEDLIDLEAFERENAWEIGNFLGNNPDSALECAICLVRIKATPNYEFGILEQCDHVFCGPCIKSQQQQDANGQVICKVCQTASDRVAFVDRFVTARSNAEEKRQLFL